MKFYKIILIFLSLLMYSCSSSDDTIETPIDPDPVVELYFPPNSTDVWETSTPNSLSWNTTNLQDLYDYLEEKNSKGFIILKDGKIVVEQYFNGHTQNSNWIWYSAAKSLTSTVIGIAQDEGIINVNNKTSDYLGNNWSSLTQEKQNLITVKHHLTMTTGMQSDLTDALAWACTLPICLDYEADAGSRWAYHQGAFTLLQKMINNGTAGMTFNNYYNQKLKTKIGMNGSWNDFLFLNLYSSTTRSMARFGLLTLNKGKWKDETIVSENYYNSMISTSQNLNKSYGYLWWLNGKESFMGTNSQDIITGSIIPNAPTDMFAALGAKDQKIYVIPSKNMVIIRCGESAGLEELANSSFDNELWEKINAVID